jgi:hypothetical protein
MRVFLRAEVAFMLSRSLCTKASRKGYHLTSPQLERIEVKSLIPELDKYHPGMQGVTLILLQHINRNRHCR